jgi:hypothetical protein
MGTDWIIFLTIGNLASPPSFPFPGQVKGRNCPPPPNERISPVLAARKNRAVTQWDLLSRAVHLRDQMFTPWRGIN